MFTQDFYFFFSRLLRFFFVSFYKCVECGKDVMSSSTNSSSFPNNSLILTNYLSGAPFLRPFTPLTKFIFCLVTLAMHRLFFRWCFTCSNLWDCSSEMFQRCLAKHWWLLFKLTNRNLRLLSGRKSLM